VFSAHKNTVELFQR